MTPSTTAGHTTAGLSVGLTDSSEVARPCGQTVDINNPNTGDDFVLGAKELSLPDGSRRPYSL